MSPARFSISLLADQIKTFALTVFLVFLAGCGFQLRGTDVGALGSVSIVGADARSDIGRMLADELEFYDVSVNDSDREHTVVVVLEDRTSSRRRIATSSSIDAAEYRLALEILVTVQRGESVLVAPVNLIAERHYDVDDANLSGSVEEQNIMMQEIRRELATQIIHMLASVTPRV